jgi:hypothetical protein
MVPKKFLNQKWCDDCRLAARAESLKTKRIQDGAEAVGQIIPCKNCSTKVIKKFKRHFYCDECAKLSAASMLPHQVNATRERYARFQRERRKNPKWAIAGRMSAGIYNSLRDGKQGRSWESLVGYTIADLMPHLERQFVSGMTWKNRGKWHIDHRRPLASFSFAVADCPEFKAAWAIKNLQPLWALDNIRKGAKLNYQRRR